MHVIDYILNRICKSIVSENKFYLNKGLNTLHNIKTEGGKKPKNQFTSQGIGQLLLIKLQALQLNWLITLVWNLFPCQKFNW